MQGTSGSFRPRRRKFGWLSGLIMLFLIGPLAIIAIDGVFAPWIYLVGGRQRLLPVWAGSGEAAGPGGRYQVWMWFSPTPRGSRVLPGARVLGSGYVCTPRGEVFKLRVTGGAPGRIWSDMDGHSFHVSAYHRPIFFQSSGYDQWRPSLSFSGRWVGPDLVMTDDGSLAHAFRPNGSLDSTARNTWYPKTNTVPITLKETSWQVFTPACRDSGAG
jgi:hypothetical protein